jgi:hypothetical protein
MAGGDDSGFVDEMPDLDAPGRADREAEEAFELNEWTTKWNAWASATAAPDAKQEARFRRATSRPRRARPEPVPTFADWFAHRNPAAVVALVLVGLGIFLFVLEPGRYHIEKDSGRCKSVLEQWINPYVPPTLPAKPTLAQRHQVDLDVRERAACDQRRHPVALAGGALLAVGVVSGVVALFVLRTKRTGRTARTRRVLPLTPSWALLRRGTFRGTPPLLADVSAGQRRKGGESACTPDSVRASHDAWGGHPSRPTVARRL